MGLIFEPIPPSLGKKRGKHAKNWVKILKKVKAAPGSSARLDQVHQTGNAANTTIHRIKRQLWQKAPYEKWHFEWHPLQDKSGYGIWVIYEGMMSHDEYRMEVKARAERSALARERYEKGRLKRALLPPKPTVREITRPGSPGR